MKERLNWKNISAVLSNELIIMAVEVFQSEKINFFDFFLPIFEYCFKIKALNEKTWKKFA